MKSVLISINPKWCELIASGEKTIEVRKTKPKLETPFKVYIYQTKESKRRYTDHRFNSLFSEKTSYNSMGKVIGEFVCEKILESFLNNNDGWFVEKGCLTPEEIEKYQGNHAILYGWHITDLVIYDKPKELGVFKTFCKTYFEGDRCEDCKYFIDGRGYEYDESDCGCVGLKPFERPPQSWCYVEELKP